MFGVIPADKMVRWLRLASWAAILVGLSSGIVPAMNSVQKTDAVGEIGRSTASDMGQIIEVIESMSPGLTGDMGKANESTAKTFETAQRGGKWIAVLQFVVPLATGLLAFVVLQGMATIIEGQQRLLAQVDRSPASKHSASNRPSSPAETAEQTAVAAAEPLVAERVSQPSRGVTPPPPQHRT